MSIKKKAPRIHAMQEPKVVVSVALVPSLTEALESFCESHGFSRSKVLRELIQNLLEPDRPREAWLRVAADQLK